MTNFTITRDHRLLHKMVIVDGFGGCGKTLLSPIVAAMDRVELLSYSPEIENVSFLAHLGKIEMDAAISMIQIQADLMLYETMMARNTNFRPSDLSGAFKDSSFWKYLFRLFRKGDETIPDIVVKKKPILNLATHNLLAYGKPVIKSFGKELVIIEVVRHPLYMLKQQALNMERVLGTCRNFTIYYKYKNEQLPYYTKGWEELFLKSNAVEKVIYTLQYLTDRVEKVKRDTSTNRKTKIVTIPFEPFVLAPEPYLGKIEKTLESKIGSTAKKIIKKQNVPRKMVAAGIDLKIYKRCGWEPPKSNNEEEELKIRMEYAKCHANTKAISVLETLCEEYEKDHWKPDNCYR